jgi:hypothetical protein
MPEIFSDCTVELDGTLGVRHVEAGHVSAMHGDDLQAWQRKIKPLTRGAGLRGSR